MSEEEIKSLEMIFADLFLFVDELIKDYGEPVSPSPKQIEYLTKKIIENPANNDLFCKNIFTLSKGFRVKYCFHATLINFWDWKVISTSWIFIRVFMMAYLVGIT